MSPFESINQLQLPPLVDNRLQELARRQSEGNLNEGEQRELDLLLEAKETLAQLRAKAKTLLHPAPVASNGMSQAVRNGLPVVIAPTGTPAIDPEAVRCFLQEAAF